MMKRERRHVEVCDVAAPYLGVVHDLSECLRAAPDPRHDVALGRRLLVVAQVGVQTNV